MKTYLFVMRHLPHISAHVQEALDQLLTTAAFDQRVSVLFLDDGVFQMKRSQNPSEMALKNTASMLLALEMYDIKQLYAESESLSERGLSLGDLSLEVETIARADVNALIKRHDVVISD